VILPASSALTDFVLPVGIALGIGAALGLERELAHKPAGLRTQALITLGSTLFIVAVQSIRPGDARRDFAVVGNRFKFFVVSW
jgi:putative Mg2+ transporter-C (MgtC) family protein